MKIESIAQNSLLYDFYGQLLSKRQQEVMALYHEENFSLSEIAEEFGISRQAVHDTLKKAELALNEYEKKLGLVERFMRSKEAVSDIDERIDSLIFDLTCGARWNRPEGNYLAENCAGERPQKGKNGEGGDKNRNDEIVARLTEIKTIINGLE